jgi:hypothetical protein
MPSQGFVLVLIMSDACGHCRTFKNNELDTLRKRLYSEFKNVSLEVINLPEFGSPLPSGCPQSLRNIIAWYPMLILLTNEQWRTGTLSNCMIFNGISNPGAKPRYVSKYSLSVDHIFDWIENGN